jgi:hypothetical protein
MNPQDKLPINITFEIVQLQPPNDHWYEVTAVLSWEEEFLKRMDTALCWQDEVNTIKEAICFLVGEHFNVQEVKESETASLKKIGSAATATLPTNEKEQDRETRNAI